MRPTSKIPYFVPGGQSQSTCMLDKRCLPRGTGMCAGLVCAAVLGADERTQGHGHGQSEPGTSGAAATRHLQGCRSTIARPTSAARDSPRGRLRVARKAVGKTSAAQVITRQILPYVGRVGARVDASAGGGASRAR